jgi:hypothetical protein
MKDEGRQKDNLEEAFATWSVFCLPSSVLSSAFSSVFLHPSSFILLFDREPDPHGASQPWRSLNVNRSAVPPNDAQNGGQPKPSTEKFRGEEGLENARHNGPHHAAPGICHLDQEVIPRCQFPWVREMADFILRHALPVNVHSNGPRLVFEGLAGVRQQIQQELAQLLSVAVDWR